MDYPDKPRGPNGYRLCDRCGQETRVTITSYFNTDTLCLDCRQAEETYPRFEEARRIESEHVLAGDYNFGGIGLPVDLQSKP